MVELASSRRLVLFDVFEADFRKGELRKHGFRIRLQAQPLRVLQILLEHPGELVTREELQGQIWPSDTFVDFEKGLNNAIRKLRDALGDSAEQPRFIETRARQGYLFIGPVTSVDRTEKTEEATSPHQVHAPARIALSSRLAMGSTLILVVVTALLGLNVGGIRQRWLVKANSPAIHSLAVIPLTNLSNDPNQEYFSDGMTDALITELGQIGSLKVISRTSSMRYKQTNKSLPEIARELNVDGIIEGTVQRSGDRVRVTAQLVHGPTDKHLWANSYERDMQDVFLLERDVAGDITHQIQARITAQDQTPPAKLRPVNPNVLEAYLQGNYEQNRFGRGSGDEADRRAAAYFQQAIDADPSFAPAYNGLAWSHLNLLWPSRQDAELATKAAERAVALDPSSSEAHETLGNIKLAAWDWAGAEQEYRRAIALSASNSEARGFLGDLLEVTGRLDEGWRERQIAQELDPNWDHLSSGLELRGQYDREIAQLQMTLILNPDYGYLHGMLYRVYLKKGMYREAISQLERALILYGYPQVAAQVRRAFAVSGHDAAIREFARALEHLVATEQAFIPVNIAAAYATLGDKDRAFYWLEQAYTRHNIASFEQMHSIKTDFLFDPIRSDPRFTDLLRRIGLPP